jgi:hypothetical protein
MSLYREPGRMRSTRLVAVTFAALLVGLLAGFGLGRGTAGDPSAGELVAKLRTDLRPVSNGLAILPTEYPQAAQGSGNEAAAVRGGLDRIRAALRDTAPDLRVLDPAGADALAEAVDRLAAAVDAKAAPAEVEQLTSTAVDALHAVPGGR